jgi:hypothetical protein
LTVGSEQRLAAGLRSRGWWLLVAGALVAAGCSSPNRGVWKGTFDGSVSGVVEYEINARGTSLSGKMEGTTSEGQPFEATLEGRIEDPYFYAKFEGTSRAQIYPVRFEGLMKGEIRDGRSWGDWSCELLVGNVAMAGTWETTQQPLD